MPGGGEREGRGEGGRGRKLEKGKERGKEGRRREMEGGRKGGGRWREGGKEREGVSGE